MEHMQLNKAQYTALYRIARINRYRHIPADRKAGVEAAYQALTTIELPIGCFNFVETAYRQRPIDQLAVRQAQLDNGATQAECDAYTAVYRNAQRYARAVIRRDFETMIGAEKNIEAIAKANPELWCMPIAVNAQNSIYRLRNRSEVNL